MLEGRPAFVLEAPGLRGGGTHLAWTACCRWHHWGLAFLSRAAVWRPLLGSCILAYLVFVAAVWFLILGLYLRCEGAEGHRASLFAAMGTRLPLASWHPAGWEGRSPGGDGRGEAGLRGVSKKRESAFKGGRRCCLAETVCMMVRRVGLRLPGVWGMLELFVRG